MAEEITPTTPEVPSLDTARYDGAVDDNAAQTRIYFRVDEDGRRLDTVSKPWADVPEIAAAFALVADLDANTAASEFSDNAEPYLKYAIRHRLLALGEADPWLKQSDAPLTGGAGAVALEPLAESTGDGDALDNPGAGAVEPSGDLGASVTPSETTPQGDIGGAAPGPALDDSKPL